MIHACILFAMRYLKEINGLLTGLDDTREKRQASGGHLTRAEFQVLGMSHKLDHFLSSSLLDLLPFYDRFWKSKLLWRIRGGGYGTGRLFLFYLGDIKVRKLDMTGLDHQRFLLLGRL